MYACRCRTFGKVRCRYSVPPSWSPTPCLAEAYIRSLWHACGGEERDAMISRALVLDPWFSFPASPRSAVQNPNFEAELRADGNSASEGSRRRAALSGTALALGGRYT